jgi:hypothetical protein
LVDFYQYHKKAQDPAKFVVEKKIAIAILPQIFRQ